MSLLQSRRGAPRIKRCAYAQLILDLSPTGYWPLNEAAGATLFDAGRRGWSALVPSGTYHAGLPSLTPNDPGGNSLFFGGAGRLDAPTAGEFDVIGLRPISFQCAYTQKPEADTSTRFLMSKHDGAAGYFVIMFSGNIQFGAWTDGSNRRGWSCAFPDTGVHHLAVSWSGNPAVAPVVKIDGVSQSMTLGDTAGTPTTLTTTAKLSLGGRSDGLYHLGGMQHAALWIGQALTTAEMDALYAAYASVDRSRAIPWILDNDGGSSDKGDYQDIVHAILMHRLGLIDLKAVMVTCGDDYTAPASRAILDHYGLTSVPVGAYMGTDAHVGGGGGTPSRTIRDALLPSATRADYSDAATVYGNVLAAVPDGSLVITASGFLNSLASYLNASGANVALFNVKVRLLGLTAGQFPNSSSSASPAGNFGAAGRGEWNLGGSDNSAVGVAEAQAAADVISKVTAPVYWHGIEICGNTGNDPSLSDLIAADIPTSGWTTANPIRLGWGTNARTAWDVMGSLSFLMTAKYGAAVNPLWTSNDISAPSITTSSGTHGHNSSSAGSSNHHYMSPKVGSLSTAQWRTLMSNICSSLMPAEA